MSSPDTISASRRRLQRQTGTRLTRFREVVFRHGLPGWLLAVVLVFPLVSNQLFLEQTARLAATPSTYLLGGVGIFVAIMGLSWLHGRKLSLRQFAWVGYLLLVSAAEEWIFRVAGPVLLIQFDLRFLYAAIICNFIFGAMHYVTLRWRVQWCVMAFIGGMGFSYSFQQHGELFFIIGIHWFVTFLNTPAPPGRSL